MTITKRKGLLILIIAAVIIAIIVGYFTLNDETGSWNAYKEQDFSFELKYPHGWSIMDQLTDKSCCLFVAVVSVSTTTSMNASGTPVVTVTSKERMHLQIGYYDTAVTDPFKAATTTKVMLGDNEFSTGISNGLEFYLLPRSESRGVGIAVFAYEDATPEDLATAKDIIGTIKLLPLSASSTTATTSPN